MYIKRSYIKRMGISEKNETRCVTGADRSLCFNAHKCVAFEVARSIEFSALHIVVVTLDQRCVLMCILGAP